MIFQPIIKWSGSKRSQSEEIIKYFPKYINTYYEPFVGGASVLFQLIHNRKIYVNRFVCSDTNGDLIDLWKTIKNDPEGLYKEYARMWCDLNEIEDRQEKRKYFEAVRDEFNQTRSPYLFFFIMRTCTNGMPRYNKHAQFNNSFHITRDGINPLRVKKIIDQWSKVLKSNNVEFIRCDYKQILDKAEHGDFIYMDPPYANTRSSMYFGKIDYDDLFDSLRLLNDKEINWALSFDGKSDTDNTFPVPGDCYDNHIYIKSGNSSFRRTVGRQNNVMVYESLYLNRFS